MKDFLVLSDGTAEDANRICCAQTLATQVSGFITCAVVNELPPRSPLSMSQDAFAPSDDESIFEIARTSGVQPDAALEGRLGDLWSSVQVLRFEVPPDKVGPNLGELARRYDLFIGTLPSFERASTVLDTVLRESGRGVLGLPPGIAPAPAFKHITVAWNGSREATRAITEAMPLLSQAAEVAVLLVDSGRKAGAQLQPGERIFQHLEHHGVKAVLSHVDSDGLPISEAILTEAHRMRSDMIVMGAPPDRGFSQWFEQGVTRDVERSTDLPLLLAQ